MKLIIRKTNARLSVASGGEAPGVVKKAEAFLFMRSSIPSAQTQRVRTAFHWLAGGKFFRFRPEEHLRRISRRQIHRPHIMGVKHYWLCERCSGLFTLVYEQEQGIVLKPRWLGLPIAKASGEGQ